MKRPVFPLDVDVAGQTAKPWQSFQPQPDEAREHQYDAGGDEQSRGREHLPGNLGHALEELVSRLKLQEGQFREQLAVLGYKGNSG